MTPLQEFTVLTKRERYRGGRKARSADRRLRQMLSRRWAMSVGRAFGMTMLPVYHHLLKFLHPSPLAGDPPEEP